MELTERGNACFPQTAFLIVVFAQLIPVQSAEDADSAGFNGELHLYRIISSCGQSD